MKKMLSVLAAVIMAFGVVGMASTAFAATVASPGATTVAPTESTTSGVAADDSAQSPDTGAFVAGAAAAFVLSGSSLAVVLKKKNG